PIADSGSVPRPKCTTSSAETRRDGPNPRPSADRSYQSGKPSDPSSTQRTFLHRSRRNPTTPRSSRTGNHNAFPYTSRSVTVPNQNANRDQPSGFDNN